MANFYGKVFKAQFPFEYTFLFYKKYSFSNILMSFLQRSNKKPMGKARPYCGFLYTRLYGIMVCDSLALFEKSSSIRLVRLCEITMN